MERLRQEANSSQQLQPIRRGWKLGAEDFLDWILDKFEVSTKEAHPRCERDETEQAKALRIVQEELKRVGWTKEELKRRRKGDRICAVASHPKIYVPLLRSFLSQLINSGDDGN